MRTAPPHSRANPRQRAAQPVQRPPDIVTFSHLRWDFVFQRPQHLMVRFAKTRRVFFFEEPMLEDAGSTPSMAVRACPKSGVIIATPHMPSRLSRFATEEALKDLLDDLKAKYAIDRPIAWYYSPMMFCFSRHIEAAAIVYDCMDELANFRYASPQLPLVERELISKADILFTGGHSLYEAKRALHPRVYPFPSSVDRAHFAVARQAASREPPDQAELPHPRLGFYGVIDERMDLPLIGAMADARPNWSIVMVGPIAKLGPEEVPRRANIHYLGAKSYDELPLYLSGWDVALMPFAINEATRFISPTKTPEYLAGGKPVVSTPVTDVVRQFGDLKAVGIGRTVTSFITCCEAALAMRQSDDRTWLAEADAALAKLSWDRTFSRMNALIEEAMKERSSEKAMRNSYRTEAITPDSGLRTEV